MIDTSIVTEQNLDDLVTTAWYGGITYWAKPMKVGVISQARFEFMETEGDRRIHQLADKRLRDAYAKLVDLDQRLVNRTIHLYFIDSWRNRTEEDGIDMGSIDADAADVWVQVAAFGQVVYG